MRYVALVDFIPNAPFAAEFWGEMDFVLLPVGLSFFAGFVVVDDGFELQIAGIGGVLVNGGCARDLMGFDVTDKAVRAVNGYTVALTYGVREQTLQVFDFLIFFQDDVGLAAFIALCGLGVQSAVTVRLFAVLKQGFHE